MGRAESGSTRARLGVTALRELVEHESQFRFRDAHAVSQQVQGRHTNYENVGRFMLGLEVDTLFM